MKNVKNVKNVLLVKEVEHHTGPMVAMVPVYYVVVWNKLKLVYNKNYILETYTRYQY